MIKNMERKVDCRKGKNNLVFEKLEALELNGDGRDFIEGFCIGVVAGMAGSLVALLLAL